MGPGEGAGVLVKVQRALGKVQGVLGKVQGGPENGAALRKVPRLLQF